MLVYRFQNTKEIETKSYCEDIMNIWLGYRDNDEFEFDEELADEIFYEWETFINLRLSAEEFAELSPFEWIEKILSFETEEEVYDFQMAHKLEGVFAIPPTKTLEEAFNLSKNPELGLHNTYLVIGEANVIEELPHPFGLLVELEKIKEIIEVPKEYQKQEG